MWDREMRGNDQVKHLSRVCFPCYGGRFQYNSIRPLWWVSHSAKCENPKIAQFYARTFWGST